MPTSLTLGSFTPSVLLRVARRTGALSAVGLEVAETPVPSSPAQFAALLDGTLDAVLTSPDNVLAYRYSRTNPLGRTADARIVSAVDRGLGLALYAKAEPAELRGGTFGVDVPGSGFAFAMYTLADSVGLGRDDYEVVALGSTPARLQALLRGECAATMLNAGNELHAEAAGFRPLAAVSRTCAPYLGTVLAVVGDAHLEPARQLAAALARTAAAVVAGELDAETTAEAAAALDLPGGLAERHLARLADPAEGLVPDGAVDPAAIRTVVELRRRWRPETEGGADVLAPALEAGSGLVAS